MPAKWYGHWWRRPILDEAAGASYELSEAAYADNEAGGTWVQRLLAALAAMLQWLQPLLTPNNYDTLVASVLERVRCACGAAITLRTAAAGPCTDGRMERVGLKQKSPWSRCLGNLHRWFGSGVM